MILDRRHYLWFYDHIHSRYYDLLMKWCFFPLGGERKVRRTLLANIDFRPGEEILDMCCGSGNTTFAIAEMAGQDSTIVGIDLSAGQILRAKRRNRLSNVDFMVMDAAQTCFPNGRLDKVIIPFALHEMFHQQRMEILAEARRLLRPGGLLAVLELDKPPRLALRLFMGLWLFYWLPFNFETPTRRDMLRQGLVPELQEAGFRDVSRTCLYQGVLQVVRGRR